MVLLLNTEAAKACGCELKPPLEVAVPVAGRLNNPRTVLPPFTSKLDAGLVVPMPIFALLPVPD